MSQVKPKQSVLEFSTYPPVGLDDWRYAFETARVRSLETQMLTRATFLDMANSESLEQAADLLGSGEYALGQGKKSFADVEAILLQRRADVRQLFADLMIDRPIVELFKSRDDFANLRLALRRILTEKPLGDGYSPEGNVSKDMLEQVFAEENYDLFPEYVREAVEKTIIAYYQNKDIRQIDYAIDAVQAAYNLARAQKLGSAFLLGLFRTQIDLTNIRTLLRLKFTESDQLNVFLQGGFLEPDHFKRGLDAGYEALGALFFATPYQRLVETAANYLASNKSFLKAEQQSDEHITGFLKSTAQITAGPQPVIAYLLMKEHEIRTVRLVLTAKKSFLDARLILDRIS